MTVRSGQAGRTGQPPQAARAAPAPPTDAAAAGRWQALRHLPPAVRRRFVFMIVPWILAFAIGFPMLWQTLETQARAPLLQARSALLHETVEILDRTLDSLQRDIVFLHDLTAELPQRDASGQAELARLYRSFARSARGYGRIRWLDADGRERLRVDSHGGRQMLAAPEDLRDESEHACFRGAIGLPRGSLYVSRLELAEQHGAAGNPHVPTLCVAAPLHDGETPAGVVALDYLATGLLDRIEALGRRLGMDVHLADEGGHWLSGPTPDQSWTRQQESPQQTLARAHPRLWQAMQAGDTGRYGDGLGDWEFRHQRMARPGVAADGSGLYVLVRLAPYAAASSALRWQAPVAVLMALGLLLALRYGWAALDALIEEDAQARALQAANRALTEANEHLRSVQADLVRAERLSSLGLMVAGVAHELNTPLGSANLSVSTLRQGLSEIGARLDTGLRRSDLDAFLAGADEASRLAQASIDRAAGIVQRFKQVAVDRTTMERRSFDLAEAVLDADPRLRHPDKLANVSLRLSLAPGLRMDSYPGPLQQVISNLLGNALGHAFPEGRHGTISISASADGPSHVLIEFADDGVGIEPGHLERIFDPFFTTGRHRGGSGLGLHICAQLVNEVLGGTIRAGDRAARGGGSGAVFTLRLPRAAPVTPPPASGAAP